jgi:serine/threonine protein kinase
MPPSSKASLTTDELGTLKAGPKKKKSAPKHVSVGVYQLGDCIGKGAFGTVYRGLNSISGEVVAIKQFDLDRVSGDEVESFTTEIRLLRDLTHPNIVRYIDFIKSDSHLNLILEYVEQGSLLNIVKQFGSLTENLASLYIKQTLQGLSYLHSKGVAHCDIKCANILTTKKGELKLTDFGVSKTLSKAESGSLTEDAVGTPYWYGYCPSDIIYICRMAPEVIELKGITPAADIWSLGCTIIELVTGSPPYADLQSMSALFRIVQDDHPPMPEGLSDELNSLLRACFKKNPAERPTADELLRHPFFEKYKTDTASLNPQKVATEEDLQALEKLVAKKSSKSRRQSTIHMTSQRKSAEATTLEKHAKALQNRLEPLAASVSVVAEENVRKEESEMLVKGFILNTDPVPLLDGIKKPANEKGFLSKSYPPDI